MAQSPGGGTPANLLPRPDQGGRPLRIVVASRNPGKLREIRLLLDPLGIVVLSPDDAGWAGRTVEDGQTLEENALKKAREGFAVAGLPALADDTGLFVDALGGGPGVRSARYAGEAEDPVANCAKLLGALDGVPARGRGAEFRTVLALVGEDGERTFVGTCRGQIGESPRGEGGFGYDSLFRLPETGKTFAEMTPEEKNRISHRGRALLALRRYLTAASGKEVA